MYIKVRVECGTKKEIVQKKSIDTYSIQLREEKKNGSANKRLLEILTEIYTVDGKKPKIRIVSGHLHPSKIFSIDHEAFT